MNRKEFLEILRSQLAGQMQKFLLFSPPHSLHCLHSCRAFILSYGSSYGNETEFPHQQEKRWKKVIDLSTWHGRAVVIAAAAVIIILLILIIGVAIPFFIILAIILYFLSWLKKRNNQ